jgi:hypothetical protein
MNSGKATQYCDLAGKVPFGEKAIFRRPKKAT